MGRTARDSRDRRRPEPVKKIVLSENTPTLKLVLVIALGLVGVVGLVYAAMGLFRTDSGWRTIEAETSGATNCAEEFVFQYNLGASGVAAGVEKRELTRIYTEATTKAYQLFSVNEAIDGVRNVCYINRHPNEEIEVDPVLYDAFSLLEECGNRMLFLGPVYAQYSNLFFCAYDEEARDVDAQYNPELKAYFEEIASFANDEDAIRIELLGNNRIRLFVSEEYLAYQKKEGFTEWIDFFWMKNAFIIDFLTDTMVGSGYSLGNLSSFDGFVRNLDESGAVYSYNVFDCAEDTVYPAGVMNYHGKAAIVYLKDYPLNSLSGQYYYEYKTGERRSPYLSMEDGLARTALPNLISYSYEHGCARVLMEMIPVYITDEFLASDVWSMQKNGVYSVVSTDKVLFYNDSSLTLSDLFEKESVRYSSAYVPQSELE